MSGLAHALRPPGRAEVHVWHGTLDHPAPVTEDLSQLLCDDERARADRFLSARVRARYIAGRAQLRRLLGAYLGCPAPSVRLRYGTHGKPELAGPGPCFNLSHADRHLLIAVSEAAPIGVDLELDDRAVAHDGIARRFFSSAEAATLRALAPELQARAFLAGWTRKEAFVKALGDGLSRGLDAFDVSLAPGEPPALLRTAWSSSEPARWSVIDLTDPSAGYVAAVAVRLAPGTAKMHRWPLSRLDFDACRDAAGA
jgi:4'-phosphopantetheinyl transferase